MDKVRVYLDNCCFNRPYDDQTQERIHIEAMSKLYIQKLIKKKQVDFIWSFILDFENSRNPFNIRREAILKFSYRCTEYVDPTKKKDIINLANNIMETGIKEKDALHVSCAIYSKCDYFITTDDRLLKLVRKDIALINPMMFVKEMEGNE